ncbi:glycosyltransferase family 39 protein [Candidatus Gracilibacteria bacterium]|nr:glycosyltransferase family 39 protein [Candidatus Gracilibacteria bacterium]
MLERMALAGLLALALFLALINLPYAPRTWFDEGSHLHVPETLLRYGVYADISSEGFRYYGPTVGVGPTVMLPIALSFQLAGVGLLQGRIVIVAYFLVAVVAFYLLARRISGPRVALLALTLMLASRTVRYEGVIEYGRQVLGEVPGIAFLLLGMLAWSAAVKTRHNAISDRSTVYAGLAGLAFGLALVTKNQFVLIVPPMLALIAVLDWRYYKIGSWPMRLLPFFIACSCFGVWTLIQLQFLGPGSFAANLAQTRRAAAGAIFVFEFDATRRALIYIVESYAGLLVPALAYGLWRCRRRSAEALVLLPTILLPSLWLCWYLVSLGWPRYAFPAVVFGALAVAVLVRDTFVWLRKRSQHRLAWVVASYVALVVLVPLALSTRVVFTPTDAAQRMAAYMNDAIPDTVIVETWEPEMAVFTDHNFHYPPIELLDVAVRNTWLDGPPLVYDGLAVRPPYVLIGSFGSWVAIYDQDVLDSEYELLYSADPYAFYGRK